MDAATVASLIALIIACIALLIAVAQVIQQYFQTGQLIRLCDQVVFGPMPGHGQRAWAASQFRFRVRYAIPQISISSTIWPNDGPFTGSFAVGQHSLEELKLLTSVTRQKSFSDDLSVIPELGLRRLNNSVPGEASWVSFCRMIYGHCGASVNFDIVEYDADRCPGDLPNVPMQVSMRDVIVLGLYSGMRCSHADFVGRNVTMQGEEGTIMTSQHPVLGPLMRFTSRAKPDRRFGAFSFLNQPLGQRITSRWIMRTADRCYVSGVLFHRRQRRNIQELHGKWSIYVGDGSGATTDTTLNAQASNIRVSRDTTASLHTSTTEVTENEEVSLRKSQDGDWKTTTAQEFSSVRRPASQSATMNRGFKAANQSVKPPISETGRPHIEENSKMKRGQNANDGVQTSRHGDELHKRILFAQQQQEKRRAKAKAIVADQDRLHRLNEATARNTATEPTKEDIDAQEREEKRAKQRLLDRETNRQMRTAKLAEIARFGNMAETTRFGNMDHFWFAQMDIMKGPWATEWGECCDLYEIQGATMVILEALLSFLPHPGIRYASLYDSSSAEGLSFRETARWLYSGASTYPSYAYNARGGVIADGTYFLVSVDGFSQPIPTIDLLYSYDWQVDIRRKDDEFNDELTLELMRLDAWLSYVGRLKEVTDGRHRLLQQTPAMVKMLFQEFYCYWRQLELSATEGGLPEIQDVADYVMNFLADEELSEAEQLFVLVACLRTLKVCHCVAKGQDTVVLRPFIQQDMHAYLV